MFEAYLVRITQDLAQNDFNRLLRYVTAKKKERILRYQRFEDAQRSLVGDLLTRYALCKRLNVRNDELVFVQNEYGKPLLLRPRGLHFNISHAGEWVACALADIPVGIDIELAKPVDYRIAESFCTKEEFLFLLQQPEETRLKHFYRFWTRKESYLKADGRGLYLPPNSVPTDKDCSYYTAELDNYVLSICVFRPSGLYLPIPSDSGPGKYSPNKALQ
jgi:4'-phosphopantetheinyl transferase